MEEKITIENTLDVEGQIPGFRVLGLKKIEGTKDYLVTLLFENPMIGLNETVSLYMTEVKLPAKFRKKIPPAFTTPFKPSQMIENLQYEIGLAFRNPDFEIERALPQGFSFVNENLFYAIGKDVLPLASHAKEYVVQPEKFSAENPNRIQLYTRLPDRVHNKFEDIVSWIHTFCAQGPAQTVLFLCAMTPYMKHVLPDEFSEESSVHAYVFGESGVGKTEFIKLMAKISDGTVGINLESDMKEILAGLAAFRDRAVQIDDLNRTASESVRAKKEAKVSSLLQMGSSAAGDICAKDVNVDLSNTALLISAEYILPNYSTINRAVLIHIREAFDSETLTYLQKYRGLYGRFLRYFISYICGYRKAVKKSVEDFYNRETFHIPNVGAAEEYAGFQRVFRHYEILRLTAYAVMVSLPVSKQREALAGMFKDAADICIGDTLEAVRKNAVTDFVKSFLRVFEQDIVADSPKEYRYDKQFIFFLYKDYIYFRGKDLTDYFLQAFSQTISTKTISKELGKAGLLVMYGSSYSEKLPEKLDEKVGGSGEHYYRVNLNVLDHMLYDQYDVMGYLRIPIIRILKEREADEKQKKKKKGKRLFPMKKKVFCVMKNESGGYHAAFKTKHGRKIYLSLAVNGDICMIQNCYYLDRSTRKTPKALTLAPCGMEGLAEKISKELDGVFYGIRFMENEILSEEELISRFLEKEKKKILLMLRDGETLRTVFRNKTHRSIYLEIRLDHGQALIFDCHYADDRSQVVPYGLTTIRFSFSMDELLRIVNTELEGGFTDVAVSEEHTLVLDRPICGSI